MQTDKKSLANQLKSNPLVWETFTELGVEVIDTWRQSSDPVRRENLWHLQRALEEVREKLNDRIDEYTK